jgi:hypothetical protein
MKTSVAFGYVKEFVAKSRNDNCLKQTYICVAIEAAARNKRFTYVDCDRLKSIVTTRLGGSDSLEDWLHAHHRVREWSFWINPEQFTKWRNKMQRTRHAWLDSLIAEFEAEDD